MKVNIKRLALLMVIAVMATFVLADTVTAESRNHRFIQGQYAATGSGTCLIAFAGFDDALVPQGGTTAGVPGPHDVVTFTMEGVFKFYRNGTGEVARTNPTIDHTNPSASVGKDGWNFDYEIERDGSITLTQTGVATGEFTQGPPKGFIYHNKNRNWRGTVSPDGKTIILNGGYSDDHPDIITDVDPDTGEPLPNNTTEFICNVSAVLIWQNDIRWGWNHDRD